MSKTEKTGLKAHSFDRPQTIMPLDSAAAVEPDPTFGDETLDSIYVTGKSLGALALKYGLWGTVLFFWPISN